MARREALASEEPMKEVFIAERNNMVLFIALNENGDKEYTNRVIVRPIGSTTVFDWAQFGADIVFNGRTAADMLCLKYGVHFTSKMVETLKFIMDFEGKIIEEGRKLWKL